MQGFGSDLAGVGGSGREGEQVGVQVIGEPRTWAAEAKGSNVPSAGACSATVTNLRRNIRQHCQAGLPSVRLQGVANLDTGALGTDWNLGMGSAGSGIASLDLPFMSELPDSVKPSNERQKTCVRETERQRRRDRDRDRDREPGTKRDR